MVALLTKKWAYYNDVDPFVCAWARELIKAGLVAPGEVDDRPIQKVQASDLAGFVQCHFFCGILGWSYALRLAGWPDDRAVWTGSCPCQPFSSAGRGDGPTDTRHLWPTWFRLIRQCIPECIFGEQVASVDGLAWFDVVSTDLEGENFAVGAVDCCAASIGAPHARQRLWFVADAGAQRFDRQWVSVQSRRSPQHHAPALWHGQAHELGDADGARYALGVGHRRDDAATATQAARKAAQQTGHWDSVEWLPCLDGKTRPTQSGLQPLADGVPARVGRLRGYGNAIVPQVAQVFIEAYMSTQQEGVMERDTTKTDPIRRDEVKQRGVKNDGETPTPQTPTPPSGQPTDRKPTDGQHDADSTR